MLQQKMVAPQLVYNGHGLWVPAFEGLPKALQLQTAVEVLEGLLLPQ
jgi:hypothetical protein